MGTFNSIDRAAAINPKTAFPLDARIYFESLTEAEAAASTAVAVGGDASVYYVGQILQVIDNGAVNAYQITSEQELKPLGGIRGVTHDEAYLEYDSGEKAIKFVFNTDASSN